MKGRGKQAVGSRNSLRRFIAFLGSINVGGRRVKMDRLRELFEGMGFSEVSTYIASGNVIFDSRLSSSTEAESLIERELERALRFAVPAYVRTPAEIADVVSHQPFDKSELEAPGHTLHVFLFRRKLSVEEQAALPLFRTEMDDLAAREREVYWLCRGKSMQSLVEWSAFKKRVPVPYTARNITMLRKLSELYPQTPSS